MAAAKLLIISDFFQVFGNYIRYEKIVWKTFVGGVPNNELSNYFHDHDVFLNTTYYESFGMAVMEAAASGIPIVSTSVGEIPFLWKNKEQILLAEEITPESFVLEIKKIFKSNELSQFLSKNARKNAERYDWGIIRKKWECTISSLGKI